MIVTKNGIGTHSIMAETDSENIVVAAIIEMMGRLAEEGQVTDDEFNNHGCGFDSGKPRNYVFIPDRFLSVDVS